MTPWLTCAATQAAACRLLAAAAASAAEPARAELTDDALAGASVASTTTATPR
jgi:hypothetical protein